MGKMKMQRWGGRRLLSSGAARQRILTSLAGVEKHVKLRLGDGSEVTSVPIQGEEELSRIDSHGKTSAVHFRKFELAGGALAVADSASVVIDHPAYGHSAAL